MRSEWEPEQVSATEKLSGELSDYDRWMATSRPAEHHDPDPMAGFHLSLWEWVKLCLRGR